MGRREDEDAQMADCCTVFTTAYALLHVAQNACRKVVELTVVVQYKVLCSLSSIPLL